MNTKPSENFSPESQERALLCARATLEKSAERVRILDVSELSSFTRYFVICSGRSDRQVLAIAGAVEEELRSKGVRPVSLEGYPEGRWVLIDFGDVVVHVFLDELRDYYDLETLWSDAKSVSIPAEHYGVAPEAASPSART